MAGQQAEQWRSFENRFMALAREEQGRTDTITNGKVLQRMDQLLRASCDYRKHPEVLVNRESPEERNFCLLETPPHGIWNYISRGISENFFERVRLCVAEAGRALPDFPRGADPEDFWLHRLFLSLRKNNSDSLFCASNEGGMILSVSVASATFCAQLARKGLAYSDPSSVLESLRTDTNQAQPPPVQNSETSAAVNIDRAIASWKRTHEVHGASLPSGGRNRAVHEIPRSDVEFIGHQVWASFFEEARLPRPVEVEWESVLSSKKLPDEGVDLGLTVALTREYARGIARTVGRIADLLTTAAISRQLELTEQLHEALWRDCLNFANGLARWNAFANWVDKVTRLPWELPRGTDGLVDQNDLQARVSKRREIFERRITLYSTEWLNAAEGAINLRLTASVSKNSRAQNNGNTTQDFEGLFPASSTLPSTWEEVRKQGSITQTLAARFLRCDPRTVRRRVKDRELTRSSKGRIVCNELLRNQIRKVHGVHVLR